MTTTTVVRPPDVSLRSFVRLGAVFAALTFGLHLLTILWTQHLGYGYFRDEFYYIACGHHLAWGFVDHGPVVALQARLAEATFGKSLLGIRMFSILAECAATFLAGFCAWAMGGHRPAQALAMLAVLCTPINIAMGDFLSMNSCEPMFWTTCVIALVLLLRGRCTARACWITFGVAAGVGLLNKPSMTFFLVAIGLGLLLTPERRVLFTRYAALGILLMFLIALPNILWQVHNHWPTLEFLHNGRVSGKNTVLPPLKFFGAQILMEHPINALLWITGIVALLRARSIRDCRWLGFAYLIFLTIMCALHAKDYYLAGIYPSILAAGSIAWEHRFASSRSVRRNAAFAFPVLETVLVLTTILILPMSSPVLRPNTWVAYTRALHLTRPADETEATSILPQFFADRFGWQEMVNQVDATYRALPAEDRARACLWGENYGETGAMDFLGPMVDEHLPASLGSQNSYWMWGPHGCTFDVVIGVTSAKPEEMAKRYESVQIVGKMDNPFAMPEEHKNIYLLRHRRPEMPVNWNEWKNYF